MFDKAKDLYRLQKQARQIKKELKNTHIEAESEGVIVTVNGEQRVVSISISDEAMGDKKKLAESLEKAFNKAVEKSQQVGAALMKDVMGDLNIPGMGGGN
ncbi:MAG: YbaB/EbfC family nucleoid-associated protein [Candidatus Peregrinibacteria bacterium]